MKFVDRSLTGDLGRKIDSSYVEIQPVASFSKSTFNIEFDNKISNRGRVIIFNNPDAPIKRMSYFLEIRSGVSCFISLQELIAALLQYGNLI